VWTGSAKARDADEPINLAVAIADLRLKYMVITSVVRDYLRDGDAQHFADCLREIRLLSTQGEVLCADFKVYTGLGERTAIDQLKAVLNLGVVEAPGPKSRQLYPGLPIWFAQLLFPDLHRRFR
jgi:lipoate synthase